MAWKEGLSRRKPADNIFSDILSPLQERGAMPYVYFYRIIGCDDEQRYQHEIIQLNERLKALGNYLSFDRSIPLTTDPLLIERARKVFEPVPLKDFGNGAVLNVLDTLGYFSVTSDVRVHQKLKAAFGVMFNLFLTNEGTVNLSILHNFSAKILLWFGNYGKLLNKRSDYNPKIVFWGSPSKHEIYFLILMSLVGFDVLVLNTSFQDLFEKVDQDNEFCLILKKSLDLPIGPSPLIKAEGSQEPIAAQPIEQVQTKVSSKDPYLILKEPYLIIKLKKTESILGDILVPVNQRSGYVGEPFPIIPAYFVRYIGVPGSTDDWEAEYFNSLYNLDKCLHQFRYLKFLETIPAPTAEESEWIHRRLKHAPQDRDELVDQILKNRLLTNTHSELLDNTIVKAFVAAINLFADRNHTANPSIVLNFSLKMVSWFNRYVPGLFAQEQENNPFHFGGRNVQNPKILYYGTIKAHEIYLLYAFHQLGCDVLFVNSDEQGDIPFHSFDPENVLTQDRKNQHSLALEAFPTQERLIRKSTVAYNASKEIEEVIYGEDVGLFKPWQFEMYSTQPITLKTTYDELKILWREPSKLRPEFKIQNKKVYVPNLFAKINGVNEELNDYWREIKELSTAPNTKLIEFVPFTVIRYTKQELYQTTSLLNQDGLLDESKVIKNRHYKWGYLKEPLQHFLIGKINELIGSQMFVEAVDEKFKLKIIMTILTLDESLIKLIEVFDYPQEIPKLIVYDYNKESLNESDAIVLAYFNLIGLDVIIFTPTNYRTIEQYVKPQLLDVHQLPFVKYDLALPSLEGIPSTTTPKPGLLARIFNLR